ncbi:stage III sporulation protein AA [Alicyclobacillus cellulosilyticus]|nr:stage III sporulation protein AA [Alicyclobacillus cellulosilyticus]
MERETWGQDAGWQAVVRLCPAEIQRRLAQLPASVWTHAEEIRFRIGQPLQLCGRDFDRFLHQDHGLTDDTRAGYVVTQETLTQMVQAVTQSSLYAVEEDLRRGFVTIPGGHRVGIAGRAVLFESGQVRTVRSITSLNVRIARERLGAAAGLAPYVVHPGTDAPCNLLILSPPQCGKTTLLRDLARSWSEGGWRGIRPRKVCIVDERSEIAGCVHGVPYFRLGPRTDVLDGCPKAEGMLMAIRSLSPEVLVTDEIGRQADRDAILEAAHAGVAVVASAHARSVDEWRSRPYMRDLFDARVFDRYVILSRRRGPGTIEQVLGREGTPLGTLDRHGRGRQSDG